MEPVDRRIIHELADALKVQAAVEALKNPITGSPTPNEVAEWVDKLNRALRRERRRSDENA